jgi:hypothetical protein
MPDLANDPEYGGGARPNCKSAPKRDRSGSRAIGFGLGYCTWVRNSFIGRGRRISNVWSLSAKLKTVSPGTGSSNPALSSGCYDRASLQFPRFFTATGGACLVTAVATIGAYGIWQEWWIGTLWLSMFVILAMSRCIPERDAVIACVRGPRRLRTRQKRSTRRGALRQSSREWNTSYRRLRHHRQHRMLITGILRSSLR